MMVWIPVLAVIIVLTASVVALVTGGGWPRVRAQAGVLLLMAILAFAIGGVVLAALEGSVVAILALVAVNALAPIAFWLDKRSQRLTPVVVLLAVLAIVLLSLGFLNLQ
jgi:hypothetical protein